MYKGTMYIYKGEKTQYSEKAVFGLLFLFVYFT